LTFFSRLSIINSQWTSPLNPAPSPAPTTTNRRSPTHLRPHSPYRDPNFTSVSSAGIDVTPLLFFR
jgi:hypothetical protein